MRSSVLQGVVLHHPPYAPLRHKGGTGRKKARPSAVGADTRSFLNEEIGDRQLSEVGLLNVKLEDAYGRLVNGLKRFYKDMRRRLVVPKEGCVSERMCSLIETAGKDLSDMGLELCVWKFEEDDMDLNFTVYRNVSCLNETLFVFYLSPVDSLNAKASDIYKRYMSYMSGCFGVRINIRYPDNDYISMILDTMSDIEEGSVEDKMLKFYNEGRAMELFSEVDAMKVDEKKLREDIESYAAVAEGDEKRLMEVLLEGMEIMPHMNVGRYDFNPSNDGFGGYDSYIHIEQCIAFVYSSNDGLEDMLIETANNDCYCGLDSPGFNKYIHIDGDYSREEFEDLVGGDEIQERFVRWTGDFYQIEKKFDVWDS